MRRVNWLVTTAALGLGIIVGFIVSSVVVTPASPSPFIKFFGGKNTPVIAETAHTDAQSTPGGSNTDVVVPGVTNGGDNMASSPAQPNPAVSPQLADQIIADYKQDIGIFFDAWKSKDIAGFRTKLAKGYTGDLLDKHAGQAEPFLAQGISIDVTQVNFDRVQVEEADNNAATLRADYRYTARDYNLVDAVPAGDVHEQTVHARVNLVKINSRWLVTGETMVY